MKNQVDDFKAATDHMTAEKVQYIITPLLFFFKLINYLFIFLYCRTINFFKKSIH